MGYSMVANAPVTPGMGFHRFLIWFLLPVEVIYLCWTVINLIFGINYQLAGNNPADIYQAYGIGLRITDVVTALAAFLVGALGVFTEVALIKMRKYGPACAQSFFVALIFVSLIYGIGLSIALQDAAQVLWATQYQVFNVAIAAFCFVYYKPRLDLFTSEPATKGVHPMLERVHSGLTNGVTAFGSETEWWIKNRGKFQLALGVIGSIFVLALVLYVVFTLSHT